MIARAIRTMAPAVANHGADQARVAILDPLIESN